MHAKRHTSMHFAAMRGGHVEQAARSMVGHEDSWN